jgi:hypothetical protein
MLDFMLDLETWGTDPGSAIASIGGCVVGDPESVFYQVVDLQSCLDFGLKVSGGTIAFWLNQSEEARQALLIPGRVKINEALFNLTQWLEWVANANGVLKWKNEVGVWGNGANFDPVLLESAYRACRLPVPWDFFQVRCYRTMKALTPHLKMIAPAIKHHALQDALAQAEHLVRIRKELGL